MSTQQELSFTGGVTIDLHLEYSAEALLAMPPEQLRRVQEACDTLREIHGSGPTRRHRAPKMRNSQLSGTVRRVTSNRSKDSTPASTSTAQILSILRQGVLTRI